MDLLSFDPLRSLDIPNVRHIKPEEWFRLRERVRTADWILFPEYWQVNALVYGWRKRVFPSISSFHLGHDKVEMTRAFQALVPEHTPQTLILPPGPESVERVLDELGLPVVLKDVRSSMGNGVHLVQSRAELRQLAQGGGVLYAQERLPIDRDLRVVVVGKEVVSAYWRIAPEGWFHNNLSQGGKHCFDSIPGGAVELVGRVARECDIDHAGFDVAMVDDHPYLLEFNVLFGTAALNAAGVRLGPRIHRYLLESSASLEPELPEFPELPQLPQAG